MPVNIAGWLPAPLIIRVTLLSTFIHTSQVRLLLDMSYIEPYDHTIDSSIQLIPGFVNVWQIKWTAHKGNTFFLIRTHRRCVLHWTYDHTIDSSIQLIPRFVNTLNPFSLKTSEPLTHYQERTSNMPFAHGEMFLSRSGI